METFGGLFVYTNMKTQKRKPIDITRHKYYNQGWRDAWKICEERTKSLAYSEGKEAGIEETKSKYNLQNTMLKAMEIQSAGMEMLTRMASVINQIAGERSVM